MTEPDRSPILDRGARTVVAARGTRPRARSWRAEALLRMFENVLEVGERPSDLVVYAAIGKAARNWDSAVAIVEALLTMSEEQTLVLQSGVPVGLLPTSAQSPMVISAVNNTVGRWSDPERFYDRFARGETIWGGLTAAAWQYIGRQGVLAGTYELLGAIGRQHLGSADLSGRWLLTAGLGGMGSSQPVSAGMLGCSTLVVEVDPAKLERARAAGGLDLVTDSLDEAQAAVTAAVHDGGRVAVGLLGNASEAFVEIARRGWVPDIVSDQTAAHDVRFGYLPSGVALADWAAARDRDPIALERAARRSILAQTLAMADLADAGAIAVENGNNLRVQAAAALADPGVDVVDGAAERIAAIPGFMERYLRPLFARGIGPFRWVALSGQESDLEAIDDLVADAFPQRPEVARWIALARDRITTQGLPARSCWLGHGERSRIAIAVNDMVADGRLSAPVLFSRDHLDSASMTHPRIGTEAMRDGSDGVSDWPLLDAMLLAAGGADLVAVHSGGGGYSGWMQSAGVSVVADGTPEAADRLRRSLDSDSGLGVLRHAIAGYPQALDAIARDGETGDVPVTLLGAGLPARDPITTTTKDET